MPRVDPTLITGVTAVAGTLPGGLDIICNQLPYAGSPNSRGSHSSGVGSTRECVRSLHRNRLRIGAGRFGAINPLLAAVDFNFRLHLHLHLRWFEALLHALIRALLNPRPNVQPA